MRSSLKYFVPDRYWPAVQVSILIAVLCGFLVLVLYQNAREEQNHTPEAVKQREIQDAQRERSQQAVQLREEALALLRSSDEELDLEKRARLLNQVVEKVDSSLNLEETADAYGIKAEALVVLKLHGEAQEAFSKYTVMGGKKLTVVELLIAQGEQEQALLAVEKLLVGKKPCEPQLAKVEILLNLEQYEQSEIIFQNLRSCHAEKRYDALEKRLKAWRESRGRN